MKLWCVWLTASLLAACSIGPRPAPSVTTYDFGLPALERTAPAESGASVLVPEVGAPAWLDTTAIHYRLAYLNPGTRRSYADSRWTAPPADLLSQRLRQRFAVTGAVALTAQDNASTEFALRTQLEEFAQIFDTAASSHALVRLHATFVQRGAREAIVQRTFVVEQPAQSSDAEGAALALTAASEGVITQLLDWVKGETDRLAAPAATKDSKETR